MGEIHKLYPSPRDSHDGDIFLQFKKVFDQREKDKTETWSQYEQSTKEGKRILLESLLQTKKSNEKYRLITHDGKEILCEVLDCNGSNYTDHPYGPHYHILLTQEGNWDGCAIEHRMPPRACQEAFNLNGSSFMVNNKKFGSIHTAHDENQETQYSEQQSNLSLA